MSLHANVTVPARDRRRLERLSAMSRVHRSQTSASKSGQTIGSCFA